MELTAYCFRAEHLLTPARGDASDRRKSDAIRKRQLLAIWPLSLGVTNSLSPHKLIRGLLFNVMLAHAHIIGLDIAYGLTPDGLRISMNCCFDLCVVFLLVRVVYYLNLPNPK